MPDYTKEPRFRALQQAAEGIIGVLAATGTKDAKSIAEREAGWHNLQGHARAVVPLALWLASRRPDLLCTIRAETDLGIEMSKTSVESSKKFWDDVKDALIDELAANGQDQIGVGSKSSTPETAREIANTYLATDYGGGQRTGGAGNTVLKRTLKLLSHTLPLVC